MRTLDVHLHANEMDVAHRDWSGSGSESIHQRKRANSRDL